MIPVYLVTETKEKLNEKARAFLHSLHSLHSLHEYAQRGELYQLITKGKCDTGLIENAVIEKLPDDKKQIFRVVKFLFQNKISIPTSSLNDFETMDEKRRLKLFGYQPAISSYLLRLFFLHLLIHVHGTEAKEHLKGGVLAACLLDMLKQCRD